MKENTSDGAREKHVPVIEPIEGGYRVTVGSVEHPMLPEHYIQWIELVRLLYEQAAYQIPFSMASMLPTTSPCSMP